MENLQFSLTTIVQSEGPKTVCVTAIVKKGGDESKRRNHMRTQSQGYQLEELLCRRGYKICTLSILNAHAVYCDSVAQSLGLV